MKTTKALVIAVLGLGCAVVGVAGAWLSIVPPLIGLALFALGGLLGLTATVWGILIKLRKTARGGALAASLGVIPFAIVATTTLLALQRSGPGINDITTDAVDPPAFVVATEHGDYPGELAAKVAAAYPEVSSLSLPIATDVALARALEVARRRGWNIVQTREDGFEATTETRVFRFRDDVVVRVRPDGSGGARVDMRSASRDGKADFGVNARRIEGFLAALARE